MRKWLFHRERPARIFEIESDEHLEGLYADGWCETYAHFTDPLEDVVTENQSETFRQLLMALNKTHTPEGRQLFADQLREAVDIVTKDDLAEIADEVGVYVMKAWKPATMVKKIIEGVNGGDNQATD